MPSMTSYTSYSSTSYASSSSTNGQQTARAYQQTSYSDSSGTSVRSRSQNLGEPVVEETRHFDDEGKEILAEGRAIEGSANGGGQQRIEDVTESDEDDVDRKYREAMEDEYAKREGGA